MPALPGHRTRRRLPGGGAGRAPGGRGPGGGRPRGRAPRLHGRLSAQVLGDATPSASGRTPATTRRPSSTPVSSPASRVRITVAPKGGGAENMSALSMLKPAQGRQGVVDFVVDTVAKAGPNACPPMVVGVGIGGTFERVAYLAKKALLRDVGSTNAGAPAGGAGGRAGASLQRPGHRPAGSWRAHHRHGRLRRGGAGAHRVAAGGRQHPVPLGPAQGGGPVSARRHSLERPAASEEKRITTPLTDEVVSGLRAGDRVLISGTVLTARDAAHKRLSELVRTGEAPPHRPAGTDRLLRRAVAGEAGQGDRLHRTRPPPGAWTPTPPPSSTWG